METEIANLEKREEEVKSDNVALRSEVDSSKQELSSVRSSLRDLTNTVQSLEEKRAEYAATNSRLQSELECSRQELEVSNLRISELESNHNRVLSDVEAARARVLELTNECEGAGKDNAELSMSLEEARVVCARLENDLIVTQSEKDAYAGKLKELEEKRS